MRVSFIFQEAERKHQEELEKIEKEKQELNEKLEEMTKQEKILYAKVRKSVKRILH